MTEITQFIWDIMSLIWALFCLYMTVCFCAWVLEKSRNTEVKEPEVKEHDHTQHIEKGSNND